MKKAAVQTETSHRTKSVASVSGSWIFTSMASQHMDDGFLLLNPKKTSSVPTLCFRIISYSGCGRSLNCVDWFLLPPATDPLIDQVSTAAKGRFTGDPSHVYEHRDSRRRGDGDEEEEVVTKVNEEIRLAVTVHHIQEEVSVVPRGAFVKNPHGLVQINRSFGGLSHSEAGKLDSFLHFSEPKKLKKKSLLETSPLNPAIDFLDVLSDDIPKGSWSLQFECGSKVCVLRSLLWLGLTFYHVPMTPQHGYIYIGDGAKNLDLAFML